MKKPDVNIALTLPYIGKVEGEWHIKEEERKATWEMYVELVTRISVVKLYPEEGSLREALNSLYSLFDITRDILKRYGPIIAQPQNNNDDISFGYIAVAVLNTVIRPLLAKWHPLLKDYEMKKKDDVSSIEHEKQWERYQELRDEIEKTRKILEDYSMQLAKIANVQSLIIHTEEK